MGVGFRSPCPCRSPLSLSSSPPPRTGPQQRIQHDHGAGTCRVVPGRSAIRAEAAGLAQCQLPEPRLCHPTCVPRRHTGPAGPFPGRTACGGRSKTNQTTSKSRLSERKWAIRGQKHVGGHWELSHFGRKKGTTGSGRTQAEQRRGSGTCVRASGRNGWPLWPKSDDHRQKTRT